MEECVSYSIFSSRHVLEESGASRVSICDCVQLDRNLSRQALFDIGFSGYFLWKKRFVNSTAEKYSASISKIIRSIGVSGGWNWKNVLKEAHALL